MWTDCLLLPLLFLMGSSQQAATEPFVLHQSPLLPFILPPLSPSRIIFGCPILCLLYFTWPVSSRSGIKYIKQMSCQKITSRFSVKIMECNANSKIWLNQSGKINTEMISYQSLFMTSHVTRQPSLKTPLRHASAAPITLYGETSNSPKLFTKLTIKFHI